MNDVAVISEILLLCNIRSVRNTWPVFKQEVSHYNPSIIAITETWLSSDIVSSYNYYNYKQFAVCRQSGQRGGGVMLLFNPSFSVFQVLPRVKPPITCDVLAVVDTAKGHCWVLVYRPPQCSAVDSEALVECLESVLTNYKYVTICGDFNMKDIDWQSVNKQSLCPIERNFQQFCESWDLVQLVNEPTRGDNVLDLVLTTSPEWFQIPLGVGVQPPLVNSDHNTVVIHMQDHLKVPMSSSKSVRCFYKADYQSMASYLSKCNWSFVFGSCSSVNDYWCALYALLCGLINEFVPIVPRKNRQECRHNLPRALRQLIHRKRKAWKNWKAYPSSASKLTFNQASRRCKLAIRTYLTGQENDLLTAGPRKFYSYVSSQLRSTNSDCHLITANGLTNNPVDISKAFSDEFSKNFSTSDSRPQPVYCDTDDNISLSLDEVNIDVTSVRVALSHLKDTAAGPDEIPAVFFKRLAYSLGVPLAIVFQHSLHQAVIPDAFRLAKVIPLYKGKGEKNAASSYRPISLTAVACKVLERIVADKIRIFLTGNKLICPQQHGFMSSRSTTTNLLSCDAVIARHLNNGSSCDVILLDFARAFDKVPHDILSRKLLNIGIKGKLHEWLMNFLSGRSQYVSYQSVSSSPVPVTSGVIQGSVLGPLLFTIFINDLPSAISTVSMWLFADDAKLVGEASTDEQCVAIQCDLEAIHEWSVRNKLFLCLPKNQCLHIGKKNRRKSYLISGTSLSVVDKCIDLGIVRNSSFTYDDHIASVISKASRAAGMIYRAFSIRSVAFLVKLFNTYVLPIVEYASPVWSPAGVGLIDDLERVLRRYTKRLPLLRDCSYGERLQRLNMVTLQDRRRKADLMIAYKILHGHYDIPPDSVGISLSKLDTRGGGSNLTVHRASSTKISRSFYYRIASKWNAMPIAAKQSNSIWTFARKL